MFFLLYVRTHVSVSDVEKSVITLKPVVKVTFFFVIDDTAK